MPDCLCNAQLNLNTTPTDQQLTEETEVVIVAFVEKKRSGLTCKISNCFEETVNILLMIIYLSLQVYILKNTVSVPNMFGSKKSYMWYIHEISMIKLTESEFHVFSLKSLKVS